MEGNKRIAIGVCGILLGLVFSGFLRQEGELLASSVRPPASEEDAIAAVYPLYTHSIVWTDAVRLSVPPHTSTNPTKHTINGYVLSSKPTATTTDISSITEHFRNYYDEKLLEDGWSIDPTYQSDAPGASVWGFSRGKEVVIFSFTPTFLNKKPGSVGHCPCTIRFDILGGLTK